MEKEAHQPIYFRPHQAPGSLHSSVRFTERGANYMTLPAKTLLRSAPRSHYLPQQQLVDRPASPSRSVNRVIGQISLRWSASTSTRCPSGPTKRIFRFRACQVCSWWEHLHHPKRLYVRRPLSGWFRVRLQRHFSTAYLCAMPSRLVQTRDDTSAALVHRHRRGPGPATRLSKTLTATDRY